MKKLINKKHVRQMIWLCTIAYFVSYITRINYGAVILEIVKSEEITKSSASLVTTAGFITYGIGQLISGYLGDKIKPKLLIFYGLMTTSAMNLLFPVCRSIYAMITVWCVNGFAQAMMWPPMVKLMTNLFGDDDYRSASVKVSWGSSFGSIAVYLLAPLCILVSGWKAVFVLSAVLGLIMGVAWMIACGKLERLAEDIPEPIETSPQPITDGQHLSRKNTATLLLIMLAIVLQGTLRDGITTWMPSYISETYGLSSFVSILTGVLLPLFGVLCFQITAWLQKKYPNELACAAGFFAAAFIAASVLSAVYAASVSLSVILSTVVTGCMHGINLLLICMIPTYFKKYKKVSLISGVLNFCTYVGSAISTYGIAVVSEKAGWQITIIYWSVIAFAGTAVCLINKKRWKAFRSGSPSNLPDVAL